MEVIGPRHARTLACRLKASGRAWLFLDYDGTLADFAPTPEDILPDAELIGLLERLARFPDRLRLAVLSGRMVHQIRQLVPIPGVLLAGTYGVEYLNWEGEEVHLVELDTFRPALEQVKRGWEALLAGRQGFFLEDKGYTIAMHAKNADPAEAQVLMPEAHEAVLRAGLPEYLSVSYAPIFLEVGHEAAHKGQSLHLLLERYHWPGAELFFIGDSEQDEPAFATVRRHGGTPILVSRTAREESAAACRLESPQAVRAWLRALAEGLEGRGG